MRLFELEEPDVLMKKIKKNCSSYLDVLIQTKKLLYRGIKPVLHDNQIAFIGKNQTNRPPLTSAVEAQIQFDKFLKQLGVKALRSNSTFCTSSIRSAEYFGNLYAIFPFNGCPFAWSKTRDDLILGPYSRYLKDVAGPNGKKIALTRFQTEYNIDFKDLAGAINSGHEIWFSGKYYALDYEHYKPQIYSLLGILTNKG